MAAGDPEKRARLLLARHGQSTWNAAGRWQGRADPPLSELGERQAEDAVTVLRARADAGLTIDRIWASPLVRAHRTAEIIGAGLDLGVETDVRLQEVDAGEWTGMTREEIGAAWPSYLTEHRRPPGFETHAHLLARALEALSAIAATAAGETVLVVTHGGVIGAVERHLDVEWLRIPNLGGREVHWGADGLELGEALVLVDPDDVEVTTPHQI
jgi:broad specificity phosphatase PhoE